MDTLDISQHIRILEEKLLHQDFSANPDALEPLLAEEFIEIDPDGRRQTRDAVIGWLLEKDPSGRWELQEFETRELAPVLVQVTYRARKIAPQMSASKGSFHHSLWRRSDPDSTQWELIFHQSTRIA